MIVEPIFIYDPGNMEAFLEQKRLLASNPASITRLGGDVTTFNSKEVAEGFVEWVDVEDDDFVAYDSTGLLLDMSVVSDPYTRVVISARPDSPREPEVLRIILHTYLIATNTPPDEVEEATLPELVDLMQLRAYENLDHGCAGCCGWPCEAVIRLINVLRSLLDISSTTAND